MASPSDPPIPDVDDWSQPQEGVGHAEQGGGDEAPPSEAEGWDHWQPTTWTDAQWHEWNSWSWGWGNQGDWRWHRGYGQYHTQIAPAEAAGSGLQHAGEPAQTSWKSWKWGQPTKADYTDPPTWSGWAHYRLWKRAVSRWDANTDVATWRRAEKILKQFDWELQARLDHLSEETLSSPQYLQEIFGILDTLAGEKETTEKRRTVRAALYEGMRKQEETLAQYSLRREAQFINAEKYLNLPDELKAIMIEEQANLSHQGIQNLRVLTGGSGKYEDVRKALRIMDVEDESIFKAKNAKNTYVASAADSSESEVDTEEDDAAFLAELENQDLGEEEALSFLSEWKSGKGERKRTWTENRQLKAARKKDRRHFEDSSSRAPRPGNKRKLSISELKKITRCANCQHKGHWHEECRNPYKPREARHGSSSSGGEKPSRSSAFVFLGHSTGTQDNTYSSFVELSAGVLLP